MQQLLQGAAAWHQPMAASRPCAQGRSFLRPPVHPRVCLPWRGQCGTGKSQQISSGFLLIFNLSCYLKIYISNKKKELTQTLWKNYEIF